MGVQVSAIFQNRRFYHVQRGMPCGDSSNGGRRCGPAGASPKSGHAAVRKRRTERGRHGHGGSMRGRAGHAGGRCGRAGHAGRQCKACTGQMRGARVMPEGDAGARVTPEGNAGARVTPEGGAGRTGHAGGRCGAHRPCRRAMRGAQGDAERAGHAGGRCGAHRPCRRAMRGVSPALVNKFYTKIC